MLSEEEKKAIERLEEQLNFWKKQNIKNSDCEIILNLITKLQKENEDLQREKEENKLIIAMANNEMLGYNQGYSDGKNQNSNATEIIIKHRQAYMHKEEVEFYKRKIEFLKKENEEKDKQIDLMADFIGQDMRCIRPEIECNKMTHDCKDCVKQYFERKVEDETK